MIARNKFNYLSLSLIGALLLITQTGCSSKPTPVVVATTGGGSDTSSTQTTTGSTGTFGSSGTVGTSGSTGSSGTAGRSPSPFDTGAGTTGSSANIFDTTLTADSRPNQTVTYVPTPSQAQLNCLSSDNGFGLQSSGQNPFSSTSSGMGANYLNAYCVDPSWGGSYNQDNLFNYGMGSFSSMDACYGYVLGQLTPYCTNDNNAPIVFQKMKMGLIRCFRKILRQQMQFTQWMPEQQQSFNYSDNSLYSLLQIFAQQDGNSITQLGW